MQRMTEFELVSERDGAAYQVQLSSDGATLWVNGPDGSAVGRFAKRFGIDVHRSGTEQMKGLGECLFCTHTPPGEGEWHEFVEAMRRHYGLQIDRSLVRFEASTPPAPAGAGNGSRPSTAPSSVLMRQCSS